MKSRDGAKHYLEDAYNTKERFASYWHQINEVLSRNPHDLLEVGIGNGFVNKYLKERRVQATSVDINTELGPDVVADVRELPFEDGKFEMSVCYEVLEHMPYESFLRGLSELRRVSREYVVISLPDITQVYRIFMELPLIGWFRLMVPKLRLRPKERVGTEHGHFWNIGEKDRPLKKVMGDITEAGFEIEKTYRVFENPFHRFFILKVLPRQQGEG